MMKKFSLLLVCLLMAVSMLSGCGREGSSGGSQKSLYEHGFDVIAIMEEMAESEAWLSMYSVSEVTQVAPVIASQDFSIPKEVYKITVSAEAFSNVASQETMERLSARLKNHVDDSLYGNIASYLNGMAGTEAVAAASVYTAQKMFVSSELKENMVYLYVYETGYPVMVAFKGGEDNAVSASGTFIFSEEFKADSIEEIQKQLAIYSASVEVLER